MPATYEPIATQTLGSANSTITFSSIAASWTDLKLTIVGTASTSVDGFIRLNSDTGSNYSFTRLSGNGSSTNSARGTSVTSIPICYTTAWPTASPALYTVDLFSYAGATNKTILISTSTDQNGSGGSEVSVGLWRNTAAITSISIFTATSSMAAGTTATLYGIKAA